MPEAAANPMPRRTKSYPSGAGSDGLFGWTIFILLLAAFAAACWMGSFYVFGHPEKSFSYGLLRKLGKLEPPRRFELTAAPRGQFLDANQLFERFGSMPPLHLQAENQQLLRAYLRNYHQSKALVPYVIGPYNIVGAFRLGPGNFFGTGVVALARSTENPNVLLELVFPSEEKDVPSLERMLLTGLDLKLAKTLDLTAVLNARIMPDGRLNITAVPLLYGNYTSSDATGTFSLEPPQDLNIRAGLPVLNQAAVEKAEANYNSHLKRAGLASVPAATLMRVQATEPVNPGTVPVARAEAVNPAAAPPAPDAATTMIDGKPVARAVAVPRGLPPPAAPTPSPAAPLQPFAAPAAAPATIAATTASAWTVYEPGRMPRGKLVDLDTARSLADTPTEGVSYLSGDFQVSASGQNASGQKRAVMRGKRGQQNIRVIVDFPSGSTPPAEGQSISRDAQRPFQITSVEKGTDGQINVYVREVTRP